MDHYIGMDQFDYEALYPQYNTIYVVVPYKEKLGELSQSQWDYQYNEETEEDISEEEEEVVYVPKTQPKVLQLKKQSKRVVVSSDDDDVPLVSSKKGDLSGWKFTLNAATKNSYILTPPQPIKSVYNGKVMWGTTSTPTTWKAPLEGLSRPVYYTTKYLGWIVSLSLRDELLSAGATLQK
jgi:hypothetical protein